jgi:hypothetical protein
MAKLPEVDLLAALEDADMEGGEPDLTPGEEGSEGEDNTTLMA